MLGAISVSGAKRTMPIEAAKAVLLAVLAYATVGLAVGVPFVTIGIGTVDHAAKGAPWTFRLLILPGVAALWPLIVRRWIGASKGVCS